MGRGSICVLGFLHASPVLPIHFSVALLFFLFPMATTGTGLNSGIQVMMVPDCKPFQLETGLGMGEHRNIASHDPRRVSSGKLI